MTRMVKHLEPCPACAAALTNPFAGEYRAGCHGCAVRWVSNSPKGVRDRFYAQTTYTERDAFQADVLLEFGRRNALRARLSQDAMGEGAA